MSSADRPAADGSPGEPQRLGGAPDHPGDLVAAALRDVAAGWEIEVDASADLLRVVRLRRAGRAVTLVVGVDGWAVLGVDEAQLTELEPDGAADDIAGLVAETLLPLLRAVERGDVEVRHRVDRRGRLAGADVRIDGVLPHGLTARYRYRIARSARRDPV